MTKLTGGSQPPAQVQFDISQTTPIVCDNCGNPVFTNVVLMRAVSAIVSPTGQAGVVPIPSFACNACGFINAEFVPPALRVRETPEQTTAQPQADGSPVSTNLDDMAGFTGPQLVTE